jgi:hypothetical protein
MTESSLLSILAVLLYCSANFSRAWTTSFSRVANERTQFCTTHQHPRNSCCVTTTTETTSASSHQLILQHASTKRFSFYKPIGPLFSATEDHRNGGETDRTVHDNNEIKVSKGSNHHHVDSCHDRDAHVAILDKNLRQWTGRGIFQHMFPSNDDDTHDDDKDDNIDESNSTTKNKEEKKYFEWDDIHMSNRFALLSHGAKDRLDGPVNNYANFGACGAFCISRDVILKTPAFRMAEPGFDQDEWSMKLTKLRQRSRDDSDDSCQCIEQFCGWRCTIPDQRRFYVKDGIVWNCYDENGDYYGQALLFDREKIMYSDEPRPPLF